MSQLFSFPNSSLSMRSLKQVRDSIIYQHFDLQMHVSERCMNEAHFSCGISQGYFQTCFVGYSLKSPQFLGGADRLEGGNYIDLFILYFICLSFFSFIDSFLPT